MKLNLFNLELNISKKVSPATSLFSKKDIDKLNADYVDRIRNEGENYYINKSKTISLDINGNANANSDAIEKLRNDGIFIVPSFVKNDSVDNLCSLIEEQSNKYLSKLKNKSFYENEIALIQANQSKVKGYGALATYSKTVFDVRSGSDEGMIDIFNVDKLLKGTKGEELINQIINNSFLVELLDSLSTPLVISNINSYVNSGITSTRGFHVDAYKEQVKIFIYLTDVLTLNNGPYTYVKGSHKDSHYRRINQYICKEQKAKTETPVIPFDQVYPILAPKGSLVISDQSGSHRGFPQSRIGKRRVLTINCVPK